MSTQLVPPLIPGAIYKAHLGSGGFADVYLYEQQLPKRDVAVKVIRPGASAVQTGAFEAEANLMSQMTFHPAILSVFNAGTTEDGRSYMVMEYCPPPHVGALAKKQKLPVPRVLDIGVRIAGAVETLHQAGIIHRDIKPANILLTPIGHPVLTDFGIAVSSSGMSPQGDAGFSIPWAPPEQVTGQGPFGPATDVYSLGATLHTLLAGRSPFEIPGGNNEEIPMMNRVLRSPAPKIGRSDVPAELERVLTVAMAKNPAQRYASMLDFALALQQVQQELKQAPTPIDMLAPQGSAVVYEDDDDATRARAIPTFEAGGGQQSTHAIPDESATRAVIRQIDPSGGEGRVVEVDDATRLVRKPFQPKPTLGWESAAERFRQKGDDAGQQAPRSSGHGVHVRLSEPEKAEPSYEQTVLKRVPNAAQGADAEQASQRVTYQNPAAPPQRESYAAPETTYGQPAIVEEAQRERLEQDVSEAPAQPRSLGRMIAVAALAAIVFGGAVGIGVWSVMRDEGRTEVPTEQTTTDKKPENLPTTVKVAPVTGLEGKPEGAEKVTFTWNAAEGAKEYLYRVVDPLENHQVRQTGETLVTVPKVEGRTCLEVVIRLSNGKTSEATTSCVDTP